MIFMVLQAKDALGRKPTINPDLLDIKANYLDYNDMFWLVIDENDRVVGCIGCSRIVDTDQAFLHRLYIKPSLKRKGIGSKLLNTAELWMRENGVAVSKVHLGTPKVV
jgi:N-acetylglutamate synthase-like GNAT family acetyltransferase